MIAPYQSRSNNRPIAETETAARRVRGPGAALSLRRMIKVKDLTKRFGDRVAVDNVSFNCEPGTVTGFLGPNGAGKSTTMRMICSLSKPDAGTATVFGSSFGDLPNPGRRVGVLLDASAQHVGRRGQEVLSLSARTMGVGPARSTELLEYVGLDGSAARKRVGEYSLGMRQRLGIANALVGDPQVLILDEPANGLDPEGIRWMRGLLRDFADRGGTVLLSSHLLSEVDAVADRLVIISNGRIVAQGERDELLAGSGTVARAVDADSLVAAMRVAGLPTRAAADASVLIEAEPEAVGRAALTGQVVLTHLGKSDEAALEQLFFDLTGDSVDDETEPHDNANLVALQEAR